MRAYWYDNLEGDQRLPHDSGKDVTPADLEKLGVLYFRLPELDSVNELAAKRGYKNRDEITVSPEKMGAIYEDKVKSFFDEHLHEDEEIRYIRDGQGFFDVRSQDDAWVRIQLVKDDLIILPAGIYHRFTTDEQNYIQAMRLFKEEPKWTPLNRSTDLDSNEYRKGYAKKYLVNAGQRVDCERLSAYLASYEAARACVLVAVRPSYINKWGFYGSFSTMGKPCSNRSQAPTPEVNQASPESTTTGASNSRAKLLLPASCDPPPLNAPTKPVVWIIFGGTGHMGRSLVKHALSRGDLVAAVGRVFETSPEAMAAAHTDPNSLGLLCDVRARASVTAAVERARVHFGGRLDVVANCSGYGVIGACEDQDDHEIRDQFETNFMGTLNIIQATLPVFRSQRAGRYLIFSSTSGALGVPGLGPYCATKYAVEGLIEAMLYEVDNFNIKATLVEPGLVRRDDPETAGEPRPPATWGHFLVKPASEAYAHPSSPALHAKRMVQWLGDRQPTSAVKCAELVWQLAHCSYPPLRLVLGSYAIESIRDRLKSVTEELEDWKHLNYPPGPDEGGSVSGDKEKDKDADDGDDADGDGDMDFEDSIMT
ncbi:ARD/ARD' family-domain-containing protein [Xylariales sp. PMI_506]|nr:ARD/ARD' family-domain-containing protein [Xylariales sp. PMI_506]